MAASLTRPPHVSLEEWQRALRDFETYRRLLPSLLQGGHAGRIAVIRNDQVVGVWNTLTEALEEADRQFGAEPVATFKINPLDIDRFAQLDAGAPSDKEVPCPS